MLVKVQHVVADDPAVVDQLGRDVVVDYTGWWTNRVALWWWTSRAAMWW